MTNSTPLVFFGSDQFSRTILNGLIEAGYKIHLVVTTPENQSSNRNRQRPAIAELAEVHKLALLSPAKLDDEATKYIKQSGAKYAVLASYGKLLPEPVLDCFEAVINVHPSLLPLWRGPSPVEAVILSGAQKTGVSLIKLVKAMDAGPIYAQSEFTLYGNETQTSLRADLAKAGEKLLIQQLPHILDGKLKPITQNEDSATYCQLIKKADGELDWTEPARLLERQVRAYQQWPRSRAKLFERDVIVIEAAVEAGNDGPGRVISSGGHLSVGTSEDNLLIKRLKPAGKSEMNAAEFLRGLPS